MIFGSPIGIVPCRAMGLKSRRKCNFYYFFLDALQPYRSMVELEAVSKNQLFSFIIKTKVVPNVNRMPERCMERQTDRKTFQLSYQNKSYYSQADRQSDSMTVWQNSRAAIEPALVLHWILDSGYRTYIMPSLFFICLLSMVL